MPIASSLITVADATLGGSVVGILLRQKALLQRDYIDPLLDEFGFIARNPTPFIAGIPVSTRTQEATSYKADVTQHAVESGAILSDHVILQPIRVELSFDVTNWDKNYVKQAQELLERLFFERTPIDLQTEHKQLPNMVMTDLQINNSAPQWGKLDCRASFQQLSFVTLETEAFPAKKVEHEEQTGGPDTSKSAETATNNGRQTAIKSTLFTLFTVLK